jgi:hypothetical protein
LEGEEQPTVIVSIRCGESQGSCCWKDGAGRAEEEEEEGEEAKVGEEEEEELLRLRFDNCCCCCLPLPGIGRGELTLLLPDR